MLLHATAPKIRTTGQPGHKCIVIARYERQAPLHGCTVARLHGSLGDKFAYVLDVVLTILEFISVDLFEGT